MAFSSTKHHLCASFSIHFDIQKTQTPEWQRVNEIAQKCPSLGQAICFLKRSDSQPTKIRIFLDNPPRHAPALTYVQLWRFYSFRRSGRQNDSRFWPHNPRRPSRGGAGQHKTFTTLFYMLRNWKSLQSFHRDLACKRLISFLGISVNHQERMSPQYHWVLTSLSTSGRKNSVGVLGLWC